MYEELVKRLREAPSDWPDADLHYEAADAIEELMRRCEQLQYMPPPAWIPVTERLPEPNKTDSNGFAVQYLVMNGWRKAVARRTDKYWVLFGTSIVLEYVTHWMPLPEPPKEE